MTRPRQRLWAGSLAAGATGLVTLAGVLLAPVAAAADGPCRDVTHEQAEFVVCTFDTRNHGFALHWKGADGLPLGYLSRLPQTSGSPARRLLLATNAGMYHPDLAPVGLYVEGGRELKRIVTKGGGGNFFLRPNGVFFVGPQGAGVLTTDAYLKQRPKVDIATQSGPMLVIDGKLHPKFTAEGPSQKIRSGVGVRDGTTVMFAISRGPVSFGTFGRLYRDKLACPNALFLDGSISALKGSGYDVGQGLLPFGPMLGVYERTR